MSASLEEFHQREAMKIRLAADQGIKYLMEAPNEEETKQRFEIRALVRVLVQLVVVRGKKGRKRLMDGWISIAWQGRRCERMLKGWG